MITKKPTKMLAKAIKKPTKMLAKAIKKPTKMLAKATKADEKNAFSQSGKKTEPKKINWSKMDMHGYDGSSVSACGGTEDAESRKNWQLAREEIDQEEHRSYCDGKETQRLKYLRKKIEDKFNFIMH